MALCSSLQVPPGCANLILRHTPAAGQHESQIILRFSVPLLRGLLIPAHGLAIALRDAFAILISPTHFMLGIGVTLKSCRPEPQRCCYRVMRLAGATLEHLPQLILRRNIALESAKLHGP